MYDISQENVVQVWRTEVQPLVIVFSGIFQVAGIGPFDFLKETGLEKSNLIYFKDYYRSGYRQGVSNQLPSLKTIIEWCKNKISEKKVEEIYVIGASSGVLPGFICAQECGAKKAWGFGPRPVKEGFFPPMSDQGSPFRGIVKLKIELNQILAKILKRPARDWFKKGQVDWKLVDEQLEILCQVNDQARDYRIFYSPNNIADKAVSRYLTNSPGITAHEVHLPEDYSGDWITQPGWDHSVIQVMRLGKGLQHYMYSESGVF